MTVPLNPNGTPNLGLITTAGNQDVLSKHIDPTTGMLDIWNLPSDIKGATIWYDTGHSSKDENYAPEGHGKDKTVTSSYDINATPEKIMSQVSAMQYNDPKKFLAIQNALAAGPWGTVHLNGAFDPSTEKALSTAMSQYLKLTHGAGVGVSFTNYLLTTAQRVQQLGGAGSSLGGGSSPGYSTVQTDDPDTIKAAAQSAAQTALGMGLSDDQLTKFVAQFQAEQIGAQTTPAGSAAITPNLTDSAMAFAQKSDPGAYHQNQRQSFLDSLVNMMTTSSSSARPSMTPTPSV